MNRRDYRILVPACAFLTGYILLTLQHPFFWDTILLGSKHALWFFRNGFDSLMISDSLDCGHIPFTGFYLGIVWKLFGWSVCVSHLAMLPWVLGIAVQIWFLVKRFLPVNMQVPALILVFADPTLLSQLGLVSPDVFLVFFFLLATNAIFSNKKLLLTLALVGLVLSSLRGMMVAAALFLFNLLLLSESRSPKQFVLLAFRLLPSWIPAGLLAACYLGYHFLVKGWIGFQTGSPWAGNFALVSIAGAVKNILILAWRFADFGRVFLWLAGIIILIRYFRPGILFKAPYKPLTLLWCMLFLLLAPNMILYKGMANHRYLIPLVLVYSLVLLLLLSQTNLSAAWKKGITMFLVLALLSGNLWRYPEGIATGWDSTLAHWPWYKIREDVHEYILRNDITPETVGTDFPELVTFESILPGSGKESFSPINTSKNKYIFWSNIMNNFPETTKQQLDSSWIKIERWERFGVRAILYQNPR
jgi:hypothetical protein